MHIFITNALNGRDLEIFGDPKTKTLDFTYIDDFIEATMLAINNGEWNEDYNISGEDEVNIYKLAKAIITLTKSKSKIKMMCPEIAQPQKVFIDISKIKKLGYSPKTKIDKGVPKTIEWYKKNINNLDF